eukprot:scaffold7566_cov122-Isochrysis_galbana.AAC.10
MGVDLAVMGTSVGKTCCRAWMHAARRRRDFFGGYGGYCGGYDAPGGCAGYSYAHGSDVELGSKFGLPTGPRAPPLGVASLGARTGWGTAPALDRPSAGETAVASRPASHSAGTPRALASSSPTTVARTSFATFPQL